MKNFFNSLKESTLPTIHVIWVASLILIIICAMSYSVGREAVVSQRLIDERAEQDSILKNQQSEFDKKIAEKQEILDRMDSNIQKKNSELEEAKTYIDNYTSNKEKYDSEIKSLEEQISSKTAELSTLTASVEQKKGEPLYFTAGQYTAGEDFPVGKYNIELVSGNGNVHSYGAGVNETFGTRTDYYIQEYKNAKFDKGDILDLNNDLHIALVPVL